MQYAALGKTGVSVSRFALGTWTFGSGSSVQRVHTQRAADEIVGVALDAGVNLFNTADSYMGAEELLGCALGKQRHEVLIATKVGIGRRESTGAPASVLNRGLSRRHVLGALEESLRRLATDYVDLYIAHLPDTRVGIDETLRAFDQVVRDGKVRYVGFSNWPAWMIGQALGLQGPWGMSPAVAIEMHYSLLCRDIEQEFPGLIGSTQLALLVWGPLSGGHLTGKYRQLDGGPATGRLISSEHLVPPSSERCRAVTDLLFGVSSRYSASPAQISLAWLLTRPIVTTIILGATDVGQLRENLQAARLQLEPDDVAILEAGTAPQRSYPHSLIERVAELERIRMARLGGGQG